MFSKESVSVRPNWEKRIAKTGLNPDRWSEGSMVVVNETPVTLVDALRIYHGRVSDLLNALFAEGDFSKAPEFEHLSKEEVFNAAASSWAHQDLSLPLRFDIGVTDSGGYVLLGVKGDYLEGMVAASSVSKAWYEHHFEGMSSVNEINFIAEHLAHEFIQIGSLSSPPSVKEVTILSSERICAEYISKFSSSNSGVSLSEIGIGPLDAIDNLEPLENSTLSRAVIKVDPWKDILKTCTPESTWFKKFKEPRSFMLQPAWILALDEMIDFSEDIGQDSINQVLNIWLSIDPNSPVPLIVSSEYKEGYRFEDSMITPVIIDIQMPEPVEDTEEPEAVQV